METKACSGVVVMLDALGAKDLSLAGANAFLKNVNAFIGLLEHHRTLGGLASSKLGVSTEPQLSVFGDTIIYTWDLQESRYQNYLLMAVAEWVRPAIMAGFTQGILWRGAIAMGDYIWSPSVVLGPAVADAASWYEAADWIGIIATPNCSQHLSELAAAFDLKKEQVSDLHVEDGYLRYDVPLKGEENRSLWAVNWPHQYFQKPPESALQVGALNEFSPKRLFHSQLQAFAIPRGTESKFANTVRFFEHSAARRQARTTA